MAHRLLLEALRQRGVAQLVEGLLQEAHVLVVVNEAPRPEEALGGVVSKLGAHLFRAGFDLAFLSKRDPGLFTDEKEGVRC